MIEKLNECADKSCSKSLTSSRGQQTISPMYPRKIFSWENSRRNVEIDPAESEKTQIQADCNTKQAAIKKSYGVACTEREYSSRKSSTMKPPLCGEPVRRNLSDKMN